MLPTIPNDILAVTKSELPTREDTDQLQLLCINTIRALAIDAVQKANSGHPGAPMALAPLGFLLFDRHLRFNPCNPSWPNRDRFVLSNGHASMLLYSLLHLTGFDLSLQDLKQFRQIGSRTPGHPEYGVTPGVETTTGPLGQGAATSVGMAIAERWLERRFNRDDHRIIDYRIYAVCGDGDLMEGVSSEAASIAGHLGLGNLVWLYDNNHITIEGSTDLSFGEDLAWRFRAYHWNVLRVADANDLEQLNHALEQAKTERSRPTLIMIDSHIGYGSPNKQDKASAHGEPLGEVEVRLTKQNYRWPEDKTFWIPDRVKSYMGQAVQKGKSLQEQWDLLFLSYQQSYPKSAEEWHGMNAGELPDDWDLSIPTFAANEKGMAGREASNKIQNAIAARVPWLLGGSADLAPSTKTLIVGETPFSKGNYHGRNFHFGVREHSMGAILNGMALSSLRPYGATFLVFSDYMKPAIRLAALMRLPVLYVFTHDSIGLGEDGPTHQPIEQLFALRSIPNMIVLRPADANETAEAWRVIMQMKDRPLALVLTRQAVPTLDRTRYNPASGVAKGAYILADSISPEVIFIASGSEVQLCIEAYEQLKTEGIGSRVVSMPSWELFNLQSRKYREMVLPPQIATRIAVEAGGELGWRHYIGEAGTTITMNSFGESGTAKDLFQHFGFTSKNIVEKAKRLLSRANWSRTRRLAGLI